MGHHLTKDGKFKSDKYSWCPEGFFVLKFTDRIARRVIYEYATWSPDQELAEDLLEALRVASEEASKKPKG